jgi:hypothetical protein
MRSLWQDEGTLLLHSRGGFTDILGFPQTSKVNPPLQHPKLYKNDATRNDIIPSQFLQQRLPRLNLLL